MAKHIVIIQGHPDAAVRHYGHALADEYAKGAEDGGMRSSGSTSPSWSFPFCVRRTTSKKGLRRRRLSRRKPPSVGRTTSSSSIPSGLGRCLRCSKRFSNRCFARALRSISARPAGSEKTAHGQVGPHRRYDGHACIRLPMDLPRPQPQESPAQHALAPPASARSGRRLIGSIEGMTEKQRAAWLDEMRGLGDIGK